MDILTKSTSFSSHVKENYIFTDDDTDPKLVKKDSDGESSLDEGFPVVKLLPIKEHFLLVIDVEYFYDVYKIWFNNSREVFGKPEFIGQIEKERI